MRLSEKSAQVYKFIGEEGAFSYMRRLIYGGVYRYIFQKWISRQLTKKNPIELFNSTFFLSTRPLGLTEELQIYGTHEPLASSQYAAMLKQNEIVLDVGSNIGYYALLASRVTNNSATVHCFEPDPELADILIKNRDMCGETWHITEAAVSEGSGLIGFYRSAVANWGGIRKENVSVRTDELIVKATTVDEYCAKYNIVPTFLRMDIEGAEIQAIRGARGMLRKARPKIFMELHLGFLSEEERRELYGILSSMGYCDAIVIKRYYDSPWAIKIQRKFIITRMPLKDVFRLRKRDELTLALFLTQSGPGPA